VLRAARAFAEKQGWKLRIAHACGHAAEEIAAYAKAQKPGLIVMGTHGHSALANAVLGSVSQGVLARCTVPMLLIH
jgi:nucleotide-binding universal stress UspA family protein